MSENHIITATYDASLRCTTREAYQYDYGQVLRFEGFGDMLPDTFEVHFSVGNREAVTQIGTDCEVTIPDVCFTGYAPVTAWLFLHDTESDGETRFEIKVPVRQRAKPTNAEPTPVQQDVITQAIAALQQAVEDTSGSAEAAEASATAASGSADDAERYARNAATSASDANTSREFADQSATNAGVSERNAAGSASEAQAAQTASETAQEKAEAAQTAAERAQGLAESAESTAIQAKNQASGYATGAETNALKAEGYAVGKQNGVDVEPGSPYYQSNAKYYKEQASANAGTASDKATEAAQSATAAGNAQTAAETAQGKAEAAQTAAETAQGKAEDAQEAAEAVLESIPADYSELTDDVESLKSAINDAPTEATAQGILEDEQAGAYLLGEVLDGIDRTFNNMPQDETLTDIYGELVTENDWLDMIYHEVAAQMTA